MSNFTSYMDILVNGRDLDFDQSRDMLDTIFSGTISEPQIAAFLTAARIKSPAASELAGFARSLRDHATPIKIDGLFLVETCGTGGAKVKTFNISTAAAIVAAGAGVHVAKHGNSAITSNSGSADVLKALGVKIDCECEKISQCISEAGVGFMFAPRFHPAMKYVQPVRKALGFRTIFNFLGPLSNPAAAHAQVLGVADKTLMRQMAAALLLLGVQRAMVVHSSGMDEIGLQEPTDIIEIKNGKMTDILLDPRTLGIKPYPTAMLEVSDPGQSAAIIKSVLNAENRTFPRDIVALNAAAAIIVAGLANCFESALRVAYSAIDSGKANSALEKLVAISNS